MNWSARYAMPKRRVEQVSDRVQSELLSTLPDGWQIKEIRRPTSDEYVNPGKPIRSLMPQGEATDTRNWDKPYTMKSVTYPYYNQSEPRTNVPQTIIAHNPLTGNSVKILSHGAMHDPTTASVWGKRFYNPILHGGMIRDVLSRIDTRKTGVQLDLTANPVFAHYGEGIGQATGTDKIEFSAPDYLDEDKPEKPKWWPDKYDFEKEIAPYIANPRLRTMQRVVGIDHEMGHLDHNSDVVGKLRPYLSTLIDHHNSLSDDKVDKEHTLSLFDQNINNDAADPVAMHNSLNSYGVNPLGTTVHKVLKTTAPLYLNPDGQTNDYCTRSLTESYAEHFSAFHNPEYKGLYVNHDQTHAIAQEVGKKLGW
jgi:hypothetical protein